MEGRCYLSMIYKCERCCAEIEVPLVVDITCAGPPQYVFCPECNKEGIYALAKLEDVKEVKSG